MPLRLDTRAPASPPRSPIFSPPSATPKTNVDAAVAAILADVSARGDDAVIELDAALRPARTVARHTMRVLGRRDRRVPRTRCSAPALAALEFAAERIADYHRRQLPADLDYTDAAGVRLGARWRPIDSVGIYVPGGTAAYPSSVLMNAVPAKVARREARRHGGARARRRAQSAGAGRGRRLPASTRSTASAARRRWRRWPTARRPSPRWTRSSGPATPMSPPPSAASSARSAST